MKRYFSLLSFSLFLFAGTSCELIESETIVEGQVVERTTKQPIPNAYVQVYKAGKTFSSGYSKEGPLHQADSNGNFSFSLDTEGTCVLLAYSDIGHYTLWQEAPYLKIGSRNNDLKVPVQSPAWVKIKVIDELPKDQVVISIWGYEGNGDLLSLPNDTSFIRVIAANLPGKVLWDITNMQAQKVRAYKDISIAPLDTQVVEIKF